MLAATVQNHRQRTEPGECRLKHVRPDEYREQQPPWADEVAECLLPLGRGTLLRMLVWIDEQGNCGFPRVASCSLRSATYQAEAAVAGASRSLISTSSPRSPRSELAIRQPCSAFSRSLRARASFAPLGTVSTARVV